MGRLELKKKKKKKKKKADFFLIFRVVTPAPPQKSRVDFGRGVLSRLVGTRTY